MKKEDYNRIISIAIILIACVVISLTVFFVSQADNDPEPPPSDRDNNGCYTPDNVRKHYGETDCVDFSVGYTYVTSAGKKFIDEKQDYTSGFVVYIPRNSNFSSVDLAQFGGKKIKATGLIKEYNGYPEIEATEYSQVKVYQ